MSEQTSHCDKAAQQTDTYSFSSDWLLLHLRDGVYPTASHRLTWTCVHHSKFHLHFGCSPVSLLAFPWAGLANQAREAHPGFPQLGGNYSKHRLWWNAFFSFSSLCGLCPQIISSADLPCYVVVMTVIFLAWVRPEALGT